MFISDKFDFLDSCDVNHSDILSCFELDVQYIGKNRADVFVQILSGLYDGLSLDRVYSVSRTYSLILVGDYQITESLRPYSSQIYYIEQQSDGSVSVTTDQTLPLSFTPVGQLPSHEILLIASILCQECIKVCIL